MKYLLSIVCLFILCFSASSQRSIGLRANVESTILKSDNFAMLRGAGLGATLHSKWLLQLKWENGTSELLNLPATYRGIALSESLNYYSINLGRIIPLNEAKTWRIIPKVGFHFGNSEYYRFTEKSSSSSSDLGTLLIDLVSSSTHNFEVEKENLSGINGEIVIEYLFKKIFIVGLGVRYLKDQKYNAQGTSLKIGYQL